MLFIDVSILISLLRLWALANAARHPTISSAKMNESSQKLNLTAPFDNTHVMESRQAQRPVAKGAKH